MSGPAEVHEAAASTGDKEFQVPEWETAAVKVKSANTVLGSRGSLRNRFDAALPPYRRYLGLRRKTFLWLLLGVVIALLTLVIGLATGLSQHSRHDLPLPSNAKHFTGDLTYYEPGLGACGETDSSNDYIVAVSHILFDAAGPSSSTGGNSNDNPLCNRMLRASRFDDQYGEQRSVDLKVVDRCTGCNVYDLDTSLDAFEQLAPSASGRVDVTWAWLQPVQTGT